MSKGIVFELLSTAPLKHCIEVAARRAGTSQKSPEEHKLHAIRKVAAQLFSTLVLLERENFIHADIKPENILLEDDDAGRCAVKLADFGNMMRATAEEMSAYHDSFELQGQLYRAPEVIMGLPFHTPIDMWSVGCVLAELFVGEPIFIGNDNAEVLGAIREVMGLLPHAPFANGKFAAQHAAHIDRPKGGGGSSGGIGRKADCVRGSGSGDDDGSGVDGGGIVENGLEWLQIVTRLRDLLKCKDSVFPSFIAELLWLDPAVRATPIKAMQHRFLTPLFPFAVVMAPPPPPVAPTLLANASHLAGAIPPNAPTTQATGAGATAVLVGNDNETVSKARNGNRHGNGKRRGNGKGRGEVKTETETKSTPCSSWRKHAAAAEAFGEIAAKFNAKTNVNTATATVAARRGPVCSPQGDSGNGGVGAAEDMDKEDDKEGHGDEGDENHHHHHHYNNGKDVYADSNVGNSDRSNSDTEMFVSLEDEGTPPENTPIPANVGAGTRAAHQKRHATAAPSPKMHSPSIGIVSNAEREPPSATVTATTTAISRFSSSASFASSSAAQQIGGKSRTPKANVAASSKKHKQARVHATSDNNRGSSPAKRLRRTPAKVKSDTERYSVPVNSNTKTSSTSKVEVASHWNSSGNTSNCGDGGGSSAAGTAVGEKCVKRDLHAGKRMHLSPLDTESFADDIVGSRSDTRNYAPHDGNRHDRKTKLPATVAAVKRCDLPKRSQKHKTAKMSSSAATHGRIDSSDRIVGDRSGSSEEEEGGGDGYEEEHEDEEKGGDGNDDDDDPLFAPMPSRPAAATTIPTPTTTLTTTANVRKQWVASSSPQRSPVKKKRVAPGSAKKVKGPRKAASAKSPGKGKVRAKVSTAASAAMATSTSHDDGDAGDDSEYEDALLMFGVTDSPEKTAS